MNPKPKSGAVPIAPAASFPVRDGETPWTAEELAGVGQELLDEHALLGDEIDEMEADLSNLLAEGIDVAGDDQADSGAKTLERDQEVARMAKTRSLQSQVRRATSRLGDGTYGRCESCDEPIGKLRLQAFPRALVCLACKQRQDRR